MSHNKFSKCLNTFIGGVFVEKIEFVDNLFDGFLTYLNSN